MRKIIIGVLAVAVIIGITMFFFNKKEKNNTTSSGAKTERTHHLNIPEGGIESVMEANSQKIIEGTDGSIIVFIGDISRKKVDITVKRDDKILDERIISEHDKMTFNYDGTSYTLEVVNLKKPLLGVGKAEITIQ
ncbi:MAG: hypothetical protein IPI46_03330 [Bacteroidetes bacterium]|nr:hypothetical protein [Bacteroidota bacterium]